jgi:hypothetical protein
MELGSRTGPRDDEEKAYLRNHIRGAGIGEAKRKPRRSAMKDAFEEIQICRSSDNKFSLPQDAFHVRIAINDVASSHRLLFDRRLSGSR